MAEEAPKEEVPINIQRSKDIEAFLSNFPHSRRMQSAAPVLREVYAGIRPVKSDADGFYRTIMFSYLEFLTVLGEQHLKDFLQLVNKGKDIFYIEAGSDKRLIKQVFNEVITKLTSRRRKEGIENALKLLFELFNSEQTNLDKALVKLLRRLIYNLAKAHRKISVDNETLEEMVPAEDSYEDYLKEKVLADKTDATKLAIYTAPIALRITVKSSVINSNSADAEGVPVVELKANTEDFKEEVDDTLNLHNEVISVLNKDGVYSIIYRKDYAAKYPVLMEYAKEAKRVEEVKPVIEIKKVEEVPIEQKEEVATPQLAEKPRLLIPKHTSEPLKRPILQKEEVSVTGKFVPCLSMVLAIIIICIVIVLRGKYINEVVPSFQVPERSEAKLVNLKEMAMKNKI